MSQRDRDLAAIDLARRKGIMLAQLGQLAASGRLHAEAVPVAEWLAGQVRAAVSGTRLDELTALAVDPKAGIRWQPPAAITAGQYPDDDQADDYDDALDDPVPPAPRLAIPAGHAQGPMTWAGALASNGWRLAPAADGCQVLDAGRACGAETTRHITGGWVCGQHDAALSATITGRTA